MNNLRIGWAEVSITPDKKVSLVGQFAERISEYVEKPITVTAMALSTEDDQAVLCSCDLVGVSRALVLEVRSKLAGNDLGLDPEKVIISATHIQVPAIPGAVPPLTCKTARFHRLPSCAACS